MQVLIKRRSFAVLVASMLVAPASALGKCGAATYVIRGRLVRISGAARVPVQGATVTVLVDGRDPAKWLPDETRPLRVASDSDGRFESSFYFDTFKSYSWLFGHDCSREPKSVSIGIAASGYPNREVAVPAGLVKRGGRTSIEVEVPEDLTVLVPSAN